MIRPEGVVDAVDENRRRECRLVAKAEHRGAGIVLAEAGMHAVLEIRDDRQAHGDEEILHREAEQRQAQDRDDRDEEEEILAQGRDPRAARVTPERIRLGERRDVLLGVSGEPAARSNSARAWRGTA